MLLLYLDRAILTRLNLSKTRWFIRINTDLWRGFIGYKKKGPGVTFSFYQNKRNMADACDSAAVTGGDVAPPTSSLFQCKHAISPHMRRIIDCHQSFTEHWPSHRIEADTALLVDAGFYYLGEGDKVKCWYCNGGLKNWDRFDDPWIEHAKWFPLCEYLLKNKGVDFVKDILKGLPV